MEAERWKLQVDKISVLADGDRKPYTIYINGVMVINGEIILSLDRVGGVDNYVAWKIFKP